MRSSIYQKELKDWGVNSSFYQSDARHPYRVWNWEHMIASFHVRPAHKKVLEIGCGSGQFTTMLSGVGARAYGVDFSPDMIRVARSLDRTIDYRVAPAHKLPYADHSFDVVFMIMILHHLEIQGLRERSLSEVHRVLKDGGMLCILDHTGYFLSNGMLAIFNTVKKVMVRIRGEFASAGSEYERPFSSYAFVRTILKEYRITSVTPIQTIFFQFFHTFSHSLNICLVKKLPYHLREARYRLLCL